MDNGRQLAVTDLIARSYESATPIQIGVDLHKMSDWYPDWYPVCMAWSGGQASDKLILRQWVKEIIIMYFWGAYISFVRLSHSLSCALLLWHSTFGLTWIQHGLSHGSLAALSFS